jgi:hypothetical protein
MKRILHIVSLAVLVLFVSCNEHIADSPPPDRTPQTYLWLFPDSTVGVGVSRQHLRWWGEDPDGVISGYLLGYTSVTSTVTSMPFPDNLRYTWVTGNDTTLLFPLDTLFKRFVVVVRAVDNRFSGLPQQSIVRFTPSPYWDKNDNGIFDSNDVQLPSLSAATDPKGAVLTFPIRNTPPSASFIPNPLDPTQPFRQPDTTFTVATFGWTASDPDGNSTLRSYRIALNDTSNPSNWVIIPLRDTIVSLIVPRSRSDAAGSVVTADLYEGAFLGQRYRFLGQIPGLRLDATNVLYLEVKDVAGEYSPAATIPSGTDKWYVKRPQGRLLLVSDYVNSDAHAALSAYRTALAAVPGGEFTNVDHLDLDRGLTLADKAAGLYGRLVPPFVDPALINTFMLYDYVVWYTDQYPSLGLAQLTLFNYIQDQNGGRVIFSTSFLNTIDPRGALRDFAPIDSVSSVDLSPSHLLPSLGDTRIPANSVVFADSSDPGNIYPQLAFNSTPINHVIFMRPIYRRTDARYIYHLQADTRNRYLGTPNLGVVDGQGKIVFMGVPLHILDNTTFGNPLGFTGFFTKAFTHFSPSQRVNRRRY